MFLQDKRWKVSLSSESRQPSAQSRSAIAVLRSFEDGPFLLSGCCMVNRFKTHAWLAILFKLLRSSFAAWLVSIKILALAKRILNNHPYICPNLKSDTRDPNWRVAQMSQAWNLPGPSSSTVPDPYFALQSGSNSLTKSS